MANIDGQSPQFWATFQIQKNEELREKLVAETNNPSPDLYSVCEKIPKPIADCLNVIIWTRNLSKKLFKKFAQHKGQPISGAPFGRAGEGAPLRCFPTLYSEKYSIIWSRMKNNFSSQFIKKQKCFWGFICWKSMVQS